MRQIGEIKRGPRVMTDLKAVLLRPNGEEIHAIIPISARTASSCRPKRS